jgi:hypothetical protein
MAKKRAKKAGRKSMFYCRTRCTSCERTTRLCAWLPSRGWTCRACAEVGEKEIVPAARPARKKAADALPEGRRTTRTKGK